MTSPRRSPSKTPQSDDVYTMTEAARLKGVSYHTVSRAVRRGRLPATRLGRMALITAQDLQTWTPMVERAPKKYRRREPDATAVPALIDLASGERVNLAGQLALLIEANHDLVRDEPAMVVPHLAERFAQAFGLARVAIWKWDATGGSATLLAHIGPNADGRAPSTVDPNGNAARRLVLESASILPASEAAAGDTLVGGGSVQLAAPLPFGSTQLGVVVGDRRGEALTASPAQLQFAQALANQAALALELQRLRNMIGEPARAASS